MLARDRAVQPADHPGAAPPTPRRPLRAEGRVRNRPDAGAGPATAPAVGFGPSGDGGTAGTVRTYVAARGLLRGLRSGAAPPGNDLRTARADRSRPRRASDRAGAVGPKRDVRAGTGRRGPTARRHVRDLCVRLGDRPPVRSRAVRTGVAGRVRGTRRRVRHGDRRAHGHRDPLRPHRPDRRNGVRAVARLRGWAWSSGRGRRRELATAARRDPGRRCRRRGRGPVRRGRRRRPAGCGRTTGAPRRGLGRRPPPRRGPGAVRAAGRHPERPRGVVGRRS